ncbi:MAG TPA: helix-turn-helix transcriptional regulator [Alphaproteobacteria bacterium]|nr:helix-turn-helix transcriptional regulator [Alphaproteobacteria bacterium]
MIKQATIDRVDQDKKKGRAQGIDQYVGDRLKQIRKQKGMTQEDLAAKLGVTFQQVQKYENGTNRISYGKMVEVSQFLKVSLDSFIAGYGQENALSDNPQAAITGYDDSNLVTQKETDELLKVYYSLDDPKLRKNLLNLVKSMAQNMKD